MQGGFEASYFQTFAGWCELGGPCVADARDLACLAVEDDPFAGFLLGCASGAGLTLGPGRNDLSRGVHDQLSFRGRCCLLSERGQGDEKGKSDGKAFHGDHQHSGGQVMMIVGMISISTVATDVRLVESFNVYVIEYVPGPAAK